MAIYNISTSLEYNIPKATWSTGNSRETLKVRPQLGVTNFTQCSYTFSEEGHFDLLNNCRYPTEAEYGAQPSKDVMIDNYQII